MRALVVYESLYGNTAAIAAGIAAGLDDAGIDVRVSNVDDVAPDEGSERDVLVVGGPTHAHGMTRATTRMTAVQDDNNTYDDPTVGEGLRGWLDELAHADGRAAAAFDTRIDIPRFLSGAASKGIAAGLTARGFTVVTRGESFLVTKTNELVDGELARARAWGRSIAGAIVPVTTSSATESS
jgi:hypothetical protein